MADTEVLERVNKPRVTWETLWRQCRPKHKIEDIGSINNCNDNNKYRNKSSNTLVHDFMCSLCII